MKKLMILLLSVLLLFTAALADGQNAREILNPNGCELIKVIDSWIEDDTDEFIVQGALGDHVVELGLIGFADVDALPLTLDPGAVIELPDESGSNVPVTLDDLTAYVDALRESPDGIAFFCEFDMNEQGRLTRLSYYDLSDEDEEETGSGTQVWDPNPNGYSLLEVSDAWFIDEDGEYVVQGNLGEIDYSVEEDAKFFGFGEGDDCLLVILPDAVIELPDENLNNVPATVDELIGYVQAQYDTVGACSFYCTFELNETGALTRLVYCYMPY